MHWPMKYDTEGGWDSLVEVYMYVVPIYRKAALCPERMPQGSLQFFGYP